MSKKIFPHIIGNNVIKNLIGNDIVNRNCSHAYILEGAKGSGKKTAAEQIAAALSCYNKNSTSHDLPCGECDNCHRIFGNISSDVVRITSGDKVSIGIDEIRNIKNGLYVTPNDSDFRTYIIENAERMTPQAQNALLLTLEEPPSFAVFLLLTEDSTKLLETVRSRAQCIRMEKFSSTEVADYLSSSYEGKRIQKSFPERFAAAVSLSDGSLGRAAELLSNTEDTSEILKFRAEAMKLIPLMCSSKSAQMLKLGLTASIKNTHDAKIFLQILDCAIRDMVSAKRTSSENLLFYVSYEEAAKAASEASIKKLFHIHAELIRAIMRLESNVSLKIVLTDMILKIADYKRK
ncbi:MAG: hypothetical protein IKM46_04740 [Clostridia bacterium]|nr:hypothetical protein [Clostridia bacterium]